MENNKNEKKNLIIVTATICPSSNVFLLEIKDIQIRFQQYMNSLYSLLDTKYVNYIVFCDNSNYEFDKSSLIKYAHTKGKEIELLSYKSKIDCNQYGKGAGEAEIMNYILNNSILIQQVDSFYKLTGRVIIKNLDRVIKTSMQGNHFIHKRIYINNYLNEYVETIFYKLNIEQFKKLDDMRFLVNDRNGIYYEHVFFQQMQKHGIDYDSFRVYPIKHGISGSTGLRYDEPKIDLLKNKFLTSIGLADFYYTKWQDIKNNIKNRIHIQ